MNKKKILFITGTRADYGKLKPLIKILDNTPNFEVVVFVTGMHMLSKYGFTAGEVQREEHKNIFLYINQTESVPMEIVLANTISGVSNYISEFKPDLIVVHGDRIEPLAAAIVGALNNILVAHIEGGEVSGTVDEILRHSTSKLSHVHFVANEISKIRLIQMGENPSNVYVIGSPDLDIMLSKNLPTLKESKKHYEIDFDKYALFSYHPVTTEIKHTKKNIKQLISAAIESGKNYIAIYPNNDYGTNIILDELKTLKDNPHFKIFPSIRFEYFLTLLKNCEFIIGNSSAGIREAEVYGRPAINIGTRQNNRHFGDNIINVPEDKKAILDAINRVAEIIVQPKTTFGDGNSALLFYKIISHEAIWKIDTQKKFRDFYS